MSFLQRFTKDSSREGVAAKRSSSFEDLSEDQLEAHLGVKRYGSFILTDAVRPSYDLEVVPSAGYRHDKYRDRDTGIEIPVLMAAASREIILDLFIDLLDPLGDSVDIVLESSHDQTAGHHLDLGREHIDLPVLKSTLYDFEDILLDDGCTGLAVLNPQIPMEIQFDEHKLLIMYGQELSEFEETLAEYGIGRSDDIKFITEAEHVHSSSDEFVDRFEQMKFRLGIDD